VPVTIATPAQLNSSPTLLVGVFSDFVLPPGTPAAVIFQLKALRRLGDLAGKSGELHVVYPSGPGPRRLILAGLGDRKDYSWAELRKAAGAALKKAQGLKVRELGLWVESFLAARLDPDEAVRTLSITAEMALYQYREFKPARRPDEKPVPLRLRLHTRRASAGREAAWGEAVAAGANYTRTLGNRPGNRLFPQSLAQEARALARRYPRLSVRIWQKAELARAGFGALLAVGAGSAHPPVLIELNYRGGRAGQAPVALVGKGITFDSGGLSLKPSAKMDEMRFDMCGAAAVLGTIRAAAQTRLPLNLYGVVAAAENLPSGSAYRPGDILTSLSGQTIEVLNTDAEGRLVLADALTHAARRKPACIIDLATLTGAALVSLGTFASARLGNDERLGRELQAAGERTGERLWPLPLWDEYRDLLKSDVADMANIAPKPVAGTIMGGAFLERFVGGVPWVHLDIAGTANGDGGPVLAKGATGVGVHLLMEWLRERALHR